MTGPDAREEGDLVAAMRDGDERAFATVVDRHGAAMIRVAMNYVPSRGAAGEVVQETRIAVMRGIEGSRAAPRLRPDSGGGI
jgi:RNA polymerase sigma-70 factor, ECF subfamily